MLDVLGRPLRNLRLSVTDRCNLLCQYCMPEADYVWLPKEDLLHFEEISERRFGGWTMGQVNLSKINHSILLKYSEKPELDPYSVSGKVSFALLEELMATASIIGRA